MPRLKLVTIPASRSVARWWLMVGWPSSNAAVKSQTQTGSLAVARMWSIWIRVGSPSALYSAESSSARASGRGGATGWQHPLTRRGAGAVLVADAVAVMAFAAPSKEHLAPSREAVQAARGYRQRETRSADGAPRWFDSRGRRRSGS